MPLRGGGGGGAGPLMANAIKNFHFDFLHPSLKSHPVYCGGAVVWWCWKRCWTPHIFGLTSHCLGPACEFYIQLVEILFVHGWKRDVADFLFVFVKNLNICAQVREMSRTVNAAQMKLVEGEEGDKLELASLMEVTIFFNNITIVVVVNFFIIIAVFTTTMILVIAIIKLFLSLNLSSSRCWQNSFSAGRCNQKLPLFVGFSTFSSRFYFDLLFFILLHIFTCCRFQDRCSSTSTTYSPFCSRPFPTTLMRWGQVLTKLWWGDVRILATTKSYLHSTLGIFDTFNKKRLSSHCRCTVHWPL